MTSISMQEPSPVPSPTSSSGVGRTQLRRGAVLSCRPAVFVTAAAQQACREEHGLPSRCSELCQTADGLLAPRQCLASTSYRFFHSSGSELVLTALKPYVVCAGGCSGTGMSKALL